MKGETRKPTRIEQTNTAQSRRIAQFKPCFGLQNFKFQLQAGWQKKTNFSSFDLWEGFMQTWIVHKCLIVAGLLTLALLAQTLRGETFKLNNGESITGEVFPSSGNDAGVQVRVDEGKY